LEQVTLATIGGALGTLLAWSGTGVLLGRYELPVPRAAEVSIDLRVLAFSFVVSVLAGVAASLLPSLSASRTAPARAMAGARGSAPGGKHLPGSVLVAAEVALAVILLIAGGLLARNFTALVGRDLGFDPEGVVTANITLTAPRYREAQELRLEYWRSAMEALAAVPGVVATAAANPAPTFSGGRGFVAIEDRPGVDAGAAYRVVSRDYFEALDIRLLNGRVFDRRDSASSDRVTIINRSMAETYWPDADPVGERIQATSQEAGLERRSLLIIGVVEDIRHYGFADAPYTAMYVLHEQVPTHTGSMTLVARGPGDAEALVGAVRARLRELDRDLAVDVSTLETRLGGGVAGERLLAATMTLFAAVGLTLASIGIYGLLSFAVGRRTREIAVRMAVGARAADVVSMVLRNALMVVGSGVVVGMWAAYVLAHLIAALLVEVPARDPLTFAAVAVTVLLAAAGAALVPAIRAVRMAPVDALRRG
jgi:predicted permease